MRVCRINRPQLCLGDTFALCISFIVISAMLLLNSCAKSGIAIVNVADGTQTNVHTPGMGAATILSTNETVKSFTVLPSESNPDLLTFTFEGRKLSKTSLKPYRVYSGPFRKGLAHRAESGEVLYNDISSGAIFRFIPPTGAATRVVAGGIRNPVMIWRDPTQVIVAYSDFDATTGRIGLLDTATNELEFLCETPIASLKEDMGSIDLSHSGEYLLFTDISSAKLRSMDLKILDIDTKAMRTLIEAKSSGVESIRYGTWSPDDSSIVFAGMVSVLQPLPSEQEKVKIKERLDRELRKMNMDGLLIDTLTAQLDGTHRELTHSICRVNVQSGVIETLHALPAGEDVWGLCIVDPDRIVMLTRPNDDKPDNKATMSAIEIRSKAVKKLASGNFYGPLFTVQNGQKVLCQIEAPSRY